MVFYEYLCHTDGAFNIMRRLGKAPSKAPCPSCGSQAQRMLSAPMVLNGRRSSLFSAIDRAKKSRHEPEVVHPAAVRGAPAAGAHDSRVAETAPAIRPTATEIQNF